MDPDVRAIDEHIFEVGIIGHCPENSFPHACLRPSPKASVHAVSFAKRDRQITPWRASARDPQDCFDKQPIIRRGAAGIPFLTRQLRRHPFPLIVAQRRANKADLHFSALNQRSVALGIPLTAVNVNGP